MVKSWTLATLRSIQKRVEKLEKDASSNAVSSDRVLIHLAEIIPPSDAALSRRNVLVEVRVRRGATS